MEDQPSIELLERTPGQSEMAGWLKRENLGLDLLAARVHLLAGEEYFHRVAGDK